MCCDSVGKGKPPGAETVGVRAQTRLAAAVPPTRSPPRESPFPHPQAPTDYSSGSCGATSEGVYTQSEERVPQKSYPRRPP